MMNVWLTGAAPPLSVTCTVNSDVPKLQGVPMTVPVVVADAACSFRHSGSDPISVYVYG
jgi:hypothetical protein